MLIIRTVLDGCTVYSPALISTGSCSSPPTWLSGFHFTVRFWIEKVYTVTDYSHSVSPLDRKGTTNSPHRSNKPLDLTRDIFPKTTLLTYFKISDWITVPTVLLIRILTVAVCLTNHSKLYTVALSHTDPIDDDYYFDSHPSLTFTLANKHLGSASVLEGSTSNVQYINRRPPPVPTSTVGSLSPAWMFWSTYTYCIRPLKLKLRTSIGYKTSPAQSLACLLTPIHHFRFCIDRLSIPLLFKP